LPNRLSDLEDVSTFAPNGTIGLRLNTRIRGVRVVLEQVVRRWITSPGEHPADPTMVLDLTTYINHDPSESDLRRLPALLSAQAAKVDFVRQCRTKVRFVAGNLSVDAMVEIVEAGTFPLTVNIANARLIAGFGAVL
jgi:hypothetical protein